MKSLLNQFTQQLERKGSLLKHPKIQICKLLIAEGVQPK